MGRNRRCSICDSEVNSFGICPMCKKRVPTYEFNHHIYLNERHSEHLEEHDDCDYHDTSWMERERNQGSSSAGNVGNSSSIRLSDTGAYKPDTATQVNAFDANRNRPAQMKAGPVMFLIIILIGTVFQCAACGILGEL